MISKDYKYAVVGASTNPEKYGHKVFKDLLDSGYNVIPVNTKGGELLGEKVYTRLEMIPHNIDVVITVVPPEITEMIVEQANLLEIESIWMQPGSESDAAINKCKELGMKCQSGACIMIERPETII